MHWIEKERAKYNVGCELSRRGWVVYGLDHGQSDPMTDYYNPPHWDGVAEKDGLILCFDPMDYKIKMYSEKLNAKILSTPKGKTWHLQTKDGYIIAAGTGLEPCSRYGEEGRKAAARLVDRIMEKVQKPPAGRIPGFQRDRNWTWVKFREKPPQEVIEALKAAGWGWSRRREAWYNPNGAEPPECVKEIIDRY